jgi:polyisoprenoid-binding protein YceI
MAYTQETLTTYAIDPAHSRMGFTVRHMGFARVRGSFEKFEGLVRMNPEELSTLEAEGTVKAESITTSAPDRDTHLRSADFFDVENHPTITFKSTEVRDVSVYSFTIVGELTMRGVTKTVELEGKFLGEGIDPWGRTRVGFEAATKINRKDFGLNWNALLETGGVLVSEDVDITLEIQAVKQDGES